MIYHASVTGSIRNIKNLSKIQLYQHLSRCFPNLIDCA